MVVTATLLPPRLVDNRFFKSIGFWSLLFAVIALVLKHYSRFHLPEFFARGFLEDLDYEILKTLLSYPFIGWLFVFWMRIRFFGAKVRHLELLFLSTLGLTILLLDSLTFRPHIGPFWAQTLLLPLNFISAAMMLGGFLAGMIFGHHYLVNTDMPKRLLVTMAWILIGVLAFRVMAVGTTLLLYREVIRPDANFLASLTSFQGHGIFFWQRILVGLAIPAVVVAMIWSTARIGSNQSATGIMYVAIAFVFIGELAARYLFLLSAIPL